MPRFGWLALLPLLLTLPGCLWPEQSEPSNWMRQFKSQAIPPDSAQLEIAMIECPLGDEYINQKIWERTDELIAPDKRGILDDNGFRVGQLVGAPPQELQKLLLSPKSCTNLRGRIFPAGKTVPITFSATETKLAYTFMQGEEKTEIVLDQACFCFDVTARFDGEGKTVLTFVPKVVHGAAVLPFQPSAERATWELRYEKAARKHPELSFEAALGPNQYLFIGGRLERERCLGQLAFTKIEDDKETQWLMMIRNCRAVNSSDAPTNNADDLVNDRVTPLALQATLPTPRGKGR